MIFDQIKNAHLYFPISERIARALQYLAQTDFANLQPGTYEIDGENIFAIVQEYSTRPLSSAKWESHKKYIDIQYIVSGKEKMGYTDSKKVIVLQGYHQNNDIVLYKGEGNFITVEEGQFVLFFPTDIHMPQLAINIPREVKKVVVKVRTDFIPESVKEEPVTEEEDSSAQNILQTKPPAEE